MPPEFNRTHFDISEFAVSRRYSSPPQNVGDGQAPRIRQEHGRVLEEQLRVTFREEHEARAKAKLPEGLTASDGAYYEVELRKGAKAEKLERQRDHIVVGATKIDPVSKRVSTVVFIPDASVPVLENIFQDYATGELTERGNKPPNNNYVDPIETIRRARLFSFWTDNPTALPDNPQDRIWWEVWCRPDVADNVAAVYRRMECRIADEDRWLKFPESTVIPVLARRADIELTLVVADGIMELRRGSDTPNFFLEDEHDNQHDWAEDLAERTIWPGADVPRVCLLDTGVNRAHVLIEPALAEGDLMAARPGWPSADNVRESHGTPMAGLALHGDLFARLQDLQEYRLRHRLESVRIMPADGFDPNEPSHYGSITLNAVAQVEIQNPANSRVFCMAVTNDDRSGERASSWSACVDRAAAGLLAGDESDRPRRLFCISGGNVRNAMQVDRLGELADHPIEDPAQAWNALSIGGYTDKTDIDPADPYFRGHRPVVEAGDISPFSRNSTGWHSGKSPIKPEVVFEAGNRAVSHNGRDLIDCPSLELLSTGAEVDRLPIVNFAATSAATAQAARLAARLQADHPNLWPETIRALIVHSADWTERMKERLTNEGRLRERKQLVRTFGYGVPSYGRATASATSDLALMAQRTIQPYRREQSVVFNECHYYPLPWPREVLEQYGDQEFKLKITLSYFVEPNPGKSAAIDPHRYQSFGLRFDLKRPRESTDQFKQRINAQERENPRRAGAPAEPDSGEWLLGPNSISAGSLHCDVWRGTGAQLAARNIICIKPVSGWWKERRNRQICEQQGRYALIVTLTAPDAEIDLYTPISNTIRQGIEIEV
ncbi:S8 family peptidase [Thalassospira sp. NFXS8]|uniref:S8 family peptidase n=1 Tax=Thalassospira sp. NFXS8 TaxID=2819093 RepID=UPI0032DECEA0